MFRVLRMQLVTSRTILMGGDFNCTVELDERTGSDSAGMNVTYRLLVEMTDLLDLYKEMVGKGSMPQSLREGIITLLYKQKGEKEDLKNWRPIFVLNVDYRILGEAMANRLKKVIAKIVHPDPTCGIPGRQIADSLALVRDMIQHLTERIRQNRDIRGVTMPEGKGKGEVKCSLYMDISVFCADGRSIKELEKTRIEFGKVSGAKINSAKSETLLLGHWTPTRDPLPFPIKQEFLKILGVWFGGEGMAEKSWEERLVKTGEDEAGAGTVEPLEADDRREVFGHVEGDHASAPVCPTSVASALSNGQGHHENDLLLHLELQGG
ncbi:hypothetical protein NDU88_007951 [Pleurodeles waltl]|uniref:Reverse transcriptase domain-containing protein n=1 Tax=Pleurodeles waltl TaxID=8319 RepID=A0AAV7U135_PLEWA|nr:hypothetical protein NDU88_007951 [Pleurodeles waltl]